MILNNPCTGKEWPLAKISKIKYLKYSTAAYIRSPDTAKWTIVRLGSMPLKPEGICIQAATTDRLTHPSDGICTFETSVGGLTGQDRTSSTGNTSLLQDHQVRSIQHVQAPSTTRRCLPAFLILALCCIKPVRRCQACNAVP